jgi:GMP reductase
MLIKNELQLDFKDVLIEPQRSSLSSRSEVSLVKEYTFKHAQYDWSGVPIIAANMDTVGTMTMARALAEHQCMTAIHKHYSIEQLVEFFGKKKAKEDKELLEQNKHAMQHSFYSMGIVKKDIEKFEKVLSQVGYWKDGGKDHENHGIKMVCIDVANGYMQAFVDFCTEFRKKHPQLIIMAGNVVTGNIVEELIFSGVDILKVGIGPGSACTTRKMAGVGRPQLSAIIDTSGAAHGLDGRICSDGGCTVPADLGKAFGANADFVMLGGMLAGHTESEMQPFEKNGQKYLKFYGMSSGEAMKKYSGGVAEYRASEGKVVELPYRGDVQNTIQDILGGVRSTCTYVGAKNLKELPKRTTFYRTTIQTNDVYGNSIK